MNWKFFLIIVISVLSIPGTALAGEKLGDTLRSEVMMMDDWPADALMGMGSIKCPGGEIAWLNEVTPVCSSSGRIHMRKMTTYTCYEAYSATGAPEPRLTGVGVFDINGNLDAEYTGPVWGGFLIVPSLECNPADLVDPEIFWRGTWQGRRTVSCDEAACTWIGSLKIVGKGHGGDIDGKHFNGGEIITTFTPLPVSWELIPGFPVSGPEGIVTGVIME